MEGPTWEEIKVSCQQPDPHECQLGNTSLAPGKPSDDCNPGHHLDYHLMRDYKPAPPN